MALKFRRGTTAQQSGSLAFGEPYVNTTLGTLVVGGATGDIVLSTSGTGSTGNFGAISGSGLDITGNANVAGNVTIGGQLTIGDQTSDTVNVVAALSSSLIPQTTNVFDLGSASKIWRDLYISTGSIKFVDGTSVVGTFDLNSYNSLKTSTGSANTSLNALNSFSSSQLTQNSALATISGSLISSASANTVSITNINSLTASVLTQLTTLATETASLETRAATLATLTASYNSQLSAIGTETASLETRATSLATVTGSLISSASNLTQRVAANEAVSGTFARTNSANTFNGTQTVSGSLYVTQDLVVQGSSSIQNISSSNLVIGAAYVTVNTNSPSSRYAGLIIIDSGSAGGSGSFFYDAVDDEMIFIHKGNGINVTSSQVLMGPETYDNVGNEIYLTKNRILKGGGYEHVADSQITDDGTTVSIVGNLDLTGSMKAAQLTAIATITGSLITSASVNTVSLANVNPFTASVLTQLSTLGTLTGSNGVRLNNLETTSASVNTSVSNLNSFTSSQLTQNVSLATITGSLITSESNSTISISNLNAASSSYETKGRGIFSGSSQVTGLTTTNLSATAGITNGQLANSAITIAGTSTSLGGTITLATITGTSGIISGSSQISALGANIVSASSNTATIVTSIAAGSVSSYAIGGIVSGSSQVTLSSTTGGGTTANVQFGSLGIGTAASGVAGEIRATADITAYYSSDNRLKENIKPIENALDKVRKISGNTYDWKAGFEDIHSHTGEDVGVIAQEVEAVMPQLVTTREHGYKAVQYEKLAALLIEAIKEQQQHIDNLTLQVEELKKQKGL